MRNNPSPLLCAFSAILLLGCNHGPIGDAGSQREIEALLDSYQKAVSDADTTLLLKIWPEDHNVSYVSPAARIQSIDGLMEFWNYFRTSFTTRELRRKNVSIRTSGDFGWATFDWDFAATRTDGKPFNANGWETQIYHKTNLGWRIVHVHYSVPVPPRGPAQ